MSFEDGFLSLKGLHLDKCDDGDLLFLQDDIQKCCLDKQKVKEVIGKEHPQCVCGYGFRCHRCSLLTKLGLDDEGRTTGG